MVSGNSGNSGHEGNPFHGVVDSIAEWNRMRQVGSGRVAPNLEPPQQQGRTHADAWVPSTDILAHDDDLVIRVSLSGVQPEDVNIAFSPGGLEVSGQRRSGPGDDEATFYVRERHYGEFRRNWTLPTGVGEDDISAEFDNGLLEIRIKGGAVAAEPRSISIGSRSR
jgi:HSP20 family protein